MAGAFQRETKFGRLREVPPAHKIFADRREPPASTTQIWPVVCLTGTGTRYETGGGDGAARGLDRAGFTPTEVFTGLEAGSGIQGA